MFEWTWIGDSWGKTQWLIRECWWEPGLPLSPWAVSGRWLKPGVSVTRLILALRNAQHFCFLLEAGYEGRHLSIQLAGMGLPFTVVKFSSGCLCSARGCLRPGPWPLDFKHPRSCQVRSHPLFFLMPLFHRLSVGDKGSHWRIGDCLTNGATFCSQRGDDTLRHLYAMHCEMSVTLPRPAGLLKRRRSCHWFLRCVSAWDP